MLKIGGKVKYLTIDDICEMLSISRRTLERMRDTRKLARPSPMRVFNDLDSLLGNNLESVNFPEPDLFIGRSPRWEQEKLVAWLQKNGSRLPV